MRGLSAAYWLLKTNPWMKAGDTHPAPCRRRRSRPDRLAMGEAAGPARDRHRFDRSQGRAGEGARLRRDHLLPPRRRGRARASELTDGEGVTTVFDTVGKDTFEGSLKSLKRRGVLVGCGTASGPVPADRRAAAGDPGLGLFHAAGAGRLHRRPGRAGGTVRAPCSTMSPAAASRSTINQRYELDDAVQAHRDLEAGKTTGSSIFVI